MTLDTTGNWESGDDIRVIEALGLPFGRYTLDCTQNCMNELEDISPEAVLRVRVLLDEYEAARSSEINSNVNDSEGKILVKADVLEWEVTGNGQMSGSQQEMMRARYELWQYFSFCSCLSGYDPNSPASGGWGHSPLVRS